MKIFYLEVRLGHSDEDSIGDMGGDITVVEDGVGDTILGGPGDIQGDGEEGGGVESLDPPKSDLRSPKEKYDYYIYVTML